MAAGDGHIPIRGYAFRFTGTSYKDGLPLALLGTIDSEISKDGGTYANCDPGEAVALKEVGGSTDSPDFVLELSATEMTCAHAVVQVKSEATDTQHYHIFPKALPAWLTGTSQAGGSTTSIKLAATAPAYDISGTWVGVDSGACSGQVREIVSYNTTTKVATVVRAFSEAPDAMTYSVLVPEALVSALTVRAMLALPAVAAGAATGLPLNDTNVLVQADVARIGAVAQSMTDLKDFADTGYDPSTHKVAGVVTTDTATAATSVTNQVTADVTAIHGTALTETDAGHLAAAFVKLFDVHTPVLVASDVMRGTDSAALASNWTEGRAALIDQLNGATDGTLCEIVKTVLTELSNRTYNPSLHDLLGIPDETAHTLLTEIAAGNVVNVTGDVQGKVIGGGASTITGVGTWADLRQILGAMITGTAAQIVAAFTKWFNVATPTGTVNSIPDAVAGATSGLSIVGSAMALTSVERTAIGNALAAIDLAAGAIDYEAAMATGTTVGAFIAACRAVLVGKLTAPSATTKRYYDAAGTAHYIAQTHGADYTTSETPTQG